MAGKLRYMDSRPDEQERGITMKSSSIALYHKFDDNEVLINLIDSPGHVDFSSEVSTAVRLCDGCIVVVDVVEGVCPQTRACLQQAYAEKLKPILVLNKIDRLIVEKKMTPLDAYIRLTMVLEQVNAVVGNIFASDVMSKEDDWVEGIKSNHTSALEDADDSNLYFSPDSGNVIFCSAIDGWAFLMRDFAKLYEKKLGVSAKILEKVLWGDFYYNLKEKTYKKGAQEKAKKPMFVQFILENIWSIYETLMVRKDREKVPAIAEKLGIKLSPRDLRHTDPRVQLQAIFTLWLPINVAVLDSVVNVIPRPNQITEERAERLMCSLNQNFCTFPEETQNLKKDFAGCSPDSENVIVFISKMFPVERSMLPENRAKPLTQEEIQKRREVARIRHQERLAGIAANTEAGDVKSVEQMTANMSQLTTNSEVIAAEVEEEDEEAFVAFARIFSGTLKKGSKIYVLGPKHDPRSLNLENPSKSPYITEVTIGSIYLLMGRDLELIDDVPAGNIVGIGGLDKGVLKTATLSTNIYCPSFTELTLMATPILRVAVEPFNHLEMSQLVKGLKLLNQADACVQVLIQESGEHVLLTLGEVHLERCIADLEERYAKIKLHVSKPIVPFRETIVQRGTMDMVNEVIVETETTDADKTITVFTPNKQSRVQILAVSMPDGMVEILEKNFLILKAVSEYSNKKTLLPERTIKSLEELKNQLNELFEMDKSGHFPMDSVNKIWSFGPKKCGTNILLNLTDYRNIDFWNISNESQERQDTRSDYDTSFVNGFQFATMSGPLCEEPLQGVVFLIKEWSVDQSEILKDCPMSFGPFSGN